MRSFRLTVLATLLPTECVSMSVVCLFIYPGENLADAGGNPSLIEFVGGSLLPRRQLFALRSVEPSE